MMNISDRSILNINRFKSDIKDNITDRNVTLTSPFIENINVSIRPTSFDQLTDEILKIAKVFPHRTCALTYNINDKSNISIEIHPVTETA